MIRYEADETVSPVAAWAAAGEHPPLPGRAGRPRKAIRRSWSRRRSAPRGSTTGATFPGRSPPPCASSGSAPRSAARSSSRGVCGAPWPSTRNRPGRSRWTTESRLERFTSSSPRGCRTPRRELRGSGSPTQQAALRRGGDAGGESVSAIAVLDAVAAEMEALLDADQVALNRYEPSAEIAVLAHRADAGANTGRLAGAPGRERDGNGATHRRPARSRITRERGALAELAG